MNIKNQLLLLMTIPIVTVMTAAACLLNNKEIIFPEIAAIAAGGLMAPNLAWNMDKKRILLFILLCAVLGVGIVILIPLPLWAQMSLAFLLAQILYLCSGTTFAPMLSAAVLPVMLQTDTVHADPGDRGPVVSPTDHAGGICSHGDGTPLFPGKKMISSLPFQDKPP